MASALHSLHASEAAAFLLDAAQAAHEREPFVGGFFNAYGPAVHYELFSAALARGLNDTLHEEPFERGQTTCDLVLPLVGNDWLWVEVKMWWFLYEAYASRYLSYEKTRGWPLADWERLEHPPKGHHRALLLLRTWDSGVGKAKADKWLSGLAQMIPDAVLTQRALRSRTYPAPRQHTRNGDLILWSSTFGS